MKIRNCVLSIIFCLALLAPCTLWVAQEGLDLPLPGWLTADDASYLSGGIEKSKIGKYLSLSGFKSEKFQGALETEIENHIPLRADVLLSNATLQRTAIAASNALFGFEAYPTFFGSGTVYLPGSNALATFPETNTTFVDRAAQTAEGVAKIAAQYPEKNFYLVVADMSDTSKANPASALVSGSLSTDVFVDALGQAAAPADNVHVVSIPYDQAEDYYAHYYHSDHHWNGYGTLALYDKLADLADLPYRAPADPSPITFDNFVANGSYARDGLMLINETVQEPQFDLADLEVQNEEVPPVDLPDGVADMKKRGLMAEFNFYTQWYGSSLLTEQSPLVNTAAPSSKNALVVMDSYADSLHWVLARNYADLTCFRDIRAGATGEATLIERIEAAEADDVYFVGSAVAYARIPKNFPNYFNQ